ncbi:MULTISPECIES: hypothetical protein [Kitasatospora]|uniref:hypothetical protein n=1 Tax=Kitasatospora TaxID=2063 RepID=UPI000687BFBA|nr:MULTISPECIES: hypothetical protein [Kitasatospora]
MSSSFPVPAPVVRLDLRAPELAGTDPAVLRSAVVARLAEQGLSQPHDLRFLVIDTPAGLDAHHTRIEQVMAYRAPGRVRVLCLLVGGLPDHPGPAERRLLRPATLRAPEAGLVWAGDLQAGHGHDDPAGPADPQALAVLADVLSVPELFDETLDLLASLPDGVAAPALRVLEHGLSPEVRHQAWSEALLRFAGSHDPAPAGPAGDRLPGALEGLVTGSATGSPWRRTGSGEESRAHHEAVDALDTARAEAVRFGGPAGLVTGAGRAELESALGRGRQALDRYGALVGRVLRIDGGTAGTRSAAESATQLAKLGIALDPPTTTGERVGESLRLLAVGLLNAGLPLRSVAQRLTLLAGQVQPLSNSPLLAELDGLRPSTAGDRSLPPAPPGLGVLGAAGLAGLLGGLWTWPALPAALVVPLLVSLGVLAGVLRLPGGPGRVSHAVGLGVAALLGAAVSAAAAGAAGLPPWTGVVGLPVGGVLAGWLVLRAWRDHAQRWGLERGVEPLQQELHGLEALLVRALREFWAVEERRYCADAAMSVVGMLRATAAAAEEEAARDLAEPSGAAGESEEDWLGRAADDEDDPWSYGDGDGDGDGDGYGDGQYDDEADDDWIGLRSEDNPARAAGGPAAGPRPGAAGRPRWLERGEAKGGPELVPTLVGDLTDATLTALDPYWGAVERGRAGDAAQERITERVRELLAAARDHLDRNDVLPAPPFAAPHRMRSGPAGLLGVDVGRAADQTFPDRDGRGLLQLNSAEQQDLLSRNPDAVVLVRFAPESAHGGPLLDGGGEEAREVRTAAGRYAGRLRLTALRAGVVGTVRQRHGSAYDEEEQW